MLIFGTMLHDEPTRRTDPEAGIPFHLTMQGCARRMALVGLVAGNLLLMPALAEAATKGAKPMQAAAPPASGVVTPAAGSGETRVSPYAMANRRRAEASAATQGQQKSPAARRMLTATGRTRQR